MWRLYEPQCRVSSYGGGHHSTASDPIGQFVAVISDPIGQFVAVINDLICQFVAQQVIQLIGLLLKQ